MRSLVSQLKLELVQLFTSSFQSSVIAYTMCSFFKWSNYNPLSSSYIQDRIAKHTN